MNVFKILLMQEKSGHKKLEVHMNHMGKGNDQILTLAI